MSAPEQNMKLFRDNVRDTYSLLADAIKPLADAGEYSEDPKLADLADAAAADLSDAMANVEDLENYIEEEYSNPSKLEEESE